MRTTLANLLMDAPVQRVLRHRIGIWLVLLSVLFGRELQAQLPVARLDGIFPPGGAPGQSLDVTIFGADLDDVDRLHFSHPGIKAERKMADPGPFDEGKQPVENVFMVKLAGDVPPGHYAVRCQGKYGLSGPRTFVVHGSQAILDPEPNNTADKASELAAIPAVVDGHLTNAADVDWFKFEGQAGQRLVIDGLSRRIDSRADAIVTLAASDGRVLAASRRAHAGDPLLNTSLPASGTYYIKVHDALYGGGGEYAYRLLIGSMPTIDFIFPPAGVVGSNEEYTVYGHNLPGGQPSNVVRGGRALEQLKVRIAIPADAAHKLQFPERLDPHQAGLDGMEYRVSSPSGSSNPALVSIATAPVVLEQDNNNAPQSAQKLTPPCEVAGQFFPQRDVDWYSFDAKEGDDFWIEVYSHRLGLATDPMLVVQRIEKDDSGAEKITQLGWVDDVGKREGGAEFDDRTHDPAFHFIAPAAGSYRVLVRDGYAAAVGDPGLVYRLAIRPARPDFRLAAVPADSSGAVFLRKGGRSAVRVVAFRQDGYDGEIRVSASGMPAGVTAPEIIIGPASNMGTLILSAESNAAGGIGQLQVIGKGTVQNQEVARIARPAHPLQPVNFNQPNNNGLPSLLGRLAADLPVVVSDSEAARAVLTMVAPNVVETARGGVVKFKVNMTRQEGAAGNLTGFLVGLPANINLPQVGLGGNNEAEFEVRLQANTPPGTYTFHVAGMMQGMNYSRNPEAAEQAKKRQERINTLFAEAQQKTTANQQAAQQAQNELNQATAEMNQATTAKAAADQLLASSDNAAKAAAEAVVKAKQQWDAKPEDGGLKQELQTAQTASDEAAKKAKEAADAAAIAAKKLEESTTKQKLAHEKKVKADADFQSAQMFQQQAQQEKQRTDQRAQQLQQQSAMRGYNLIVPSTSATLRIAEYPIELSGIPDKALVKQGEKLDVPLKIQRLFGFDQNVTFQLVAPNGVAGLQAPNVTLAPNQADGLLAIMAQPDATPGEHAAIVRTTMAFNGQTLTLDRKLLLTIEMVEKKP